MVKQILALVLIVITTLASTLARSNEIEHQLSTAFERGELSGLHSVLVLRHGETLAEVYFPGTDERWGTPLGERDHQIDSLHDLRSVTKSIVSLLYGIALAEGKVPPVDASLIAQFPEYTDLAAEPERQAIQIHHVLTMQMGTEWNEDLPYSDPRNSEIAMELASDRYRYILERPIIQAPGQHWNYNGGATAIIGHLIAQGTGMSIADYAKEKLFSPLGIADFEWVAGTDGVPSAASGLRLTARDLAKIGQMLLNHGQYDGQQIIPADWLEAALTPHADTGMLRYGYFWWLAPEGDPPSWFAGLGNGGQRLTINPALGVVGVIFAGQYNQPDAWMLGVKVISEFIAPALKL